MNNEVIIYKDGELELPVEVTPDKETVWLRVEEMAELFDRDRSVIQRHIKNIFKEDELEQNSTCAKFAQPLETLEWSAISTVSDSVLVIPLFFFYCSIYPKPFKIKALRLLSAGKFV